MWNKYIIKINNITNSIDTNSNKYSGRGDFDICGGWDSKNRYFKRTTDRGARKLSLRLSNSDYGYHIKYIMKDYQHFVLTDSLVVCGKNRTDTKMIAADCERKGSRQHITALYGASQYFKVFYGISN